MHGVRSAKVKFPTRLQGLPEAFTYPLIILDMLDHFTANDLIELLTKIHELIKIFEVEREPVLGYPEVLIEQLFAALDFTLFDTDPKNPITLEIALIGQHAITTTGVQDPPLFPLWFEQLL